MVALVHDHDRVRARERGDERRVVGALHVHGGARVSLVCGEPGERRVLRVGASPVLVLEGVVGEHEERELLADGRRGERAAAQAVLLVQNLHAPAEVAVERHAQEVVGVAEVAERLREDLPARHEPHHDASLRGQRLRQHAHGARADEGLAASGGHLHAHLRRSAEVVAVALDAALAGYEADVPHETVVGGLRLTAHRVRPREAADLFEHVLLVLLQLHGQILAIWSGTRLKTTPISSRRSGAMAHRSAKITVGDPLRGRPRRSS